MSEALEPLQAAADEAIRSWPDVRAKQVFGHRGFVRAGKMFAFFAEEGLAFKVADRAEADELYAGGAASPFVYNGSMEMRAWPVLPVTSDAELAYALTRVRGAYESLSR